MVINELNLGPAMRWGLGVLSLLAGALALYLAQTIFIPLVIALLLAAMLWPAVRWMNQGLGFSWGFSCLLMVLALVVLNVLVTLGLALAVPKFLQGIPRDYDARKEAYTRLREQLKDISPMLLDESIFPKDPEESGLFQYVQRTLEGPYIPDALLKTLYYGNVWLWEWVLIMFLLLFLLWEGPMLTRRIVEIFGPSPEAESHVGWALADMALQVRIYLVWRTIINFGLALIVGTFYQWLGLSQSWTWAILTAILCYVPYLGPIAAGIPPVIDAFITLSPWHALAIVAFYLVIITLEGYLVFPVVMGRSMDLNATTVILACLFWELLWGLPGLFLAMPLMAGIKAICTNVPDWRVWANLMSNREAEAEISPDRDYNKTQVMLPDEIADLDKPRPARVKQK